MNTSKTNIQDKIPLSEYAIEIIDKYKTKAGKYILPRIANTNINKQLKLLIEKAGWVYNLPKIRNRMGTPVEIKNKSGNTYRFCDH